MIYRVVLLLVLSLVFMACENDESIGGSILPGGDEIVHKADTFQVKSIDVYDNVMSAQADSMYLGEFYSSIFGTTKAELLVQIAPPSDYVFPPAENNPQPDSLVLLMYYNTWYGASNTPVEISVYEIDKQKIDYNKQFLSNMDLTEYTSRSILMGKRLSTSVDLTVPDSISSEEGYIPRVRYKFDSLQMKKFYDVAKKPYSTKEEFLENFKGMYITSDYGKSTMFNFFQMDIRLHYHYTYKKNGKDTVVNTSIIFPANKEVRQLNKFSHSDLSDVVVKNDSIGYIKASAGIYQKITLPVGRIRDRMKKNLGDKIPHLNGASLRVELADMEEGDLDLTPPSAIMAITESEYEDFLKTYDIPTVIDTNKVIGFYNSNEDAYDINMSYYVIKHIRSNYDSNDVNETLELLLLPVELTQASQNGQMVTTRIRPQAKLGGVRIRSGNNKYSPMRLQMLYSGF